MAGRKGGKHNCPTSDREGKCVDRGVNRAAIVEIERTNGQVFAPNAADRAAMIRPSAKSLSIFGDINDLADTETDIFTMEGPTAEELREEDAENFAA